MNNTGPNAPLVRIHDLTVQFGSNDDSVRVLDGISLDISKNEFISVIGPSGAGKTTLLYVLAGFIPPYTGAVHVDGREIHGPGRDRGVVFQQYAVFPWLSVRKNIEFGLRIKAGRTSAHERRRISDHYLNMMGLEEFADAYPKTLSGGMRQRVAIARAYAANPQILLMDEPFGALDAQTRNFMQDRLIELMQAERQTIMFVTHSVEEAIYLSDRVAVLSPRPSTFRELITVDFGRRRDPDLRTSEDFTKLRRHVEQLLRDAPETNHT